MDNFAKKLRIRLFLASFAFVGLLIICPLGAQAQSAPGGSSKVNPTAQSSPQAVLTAFYHWYVVEVSKSRDPFNDDRRKMEVYVSKKLLREIDRLSKTPDGLEWDYFLRAQDVPEDMVSNIAVTDVRIHGSNASAVVTLGIKEKDRLGLSLSQEADGWKISKVDEAK
jgi:hypothetical protein